MAERIVEDYQEFRRKLGNQEYMDRRNLLIALIAARNFDVTSLVTDITETLHLPPLNRALISPEENSFLDELRLRLEDFPPHGYVLSDLLQTEEETKIIANWAKDRNLPLHAFAIGSSEAELAELNLEPIKKLGGVVHNLRPNYDTQVITENFFEEISPLCFEDPELAGKYYQFRDICEKLGVEHILISGACSYIYWGRRPLKDLDILVPSLDDLQKIATRTGGSVEHLVSAYADTQFLNFSSGIEAVSDLAVLYSVDEEKKRIPFTFEELMSDARQVRFLGVDCNIMSPETLLLFKFGLGRFGIDQWGHHKDDYEDANGVLVSQTIDLASLRKRAKKMGASERLALGEKILGLKVD